MTVNRPYDLDPISQDDVCVYNKRPGPIIAPGRPDGCTLALGGLFLAGPNRVSAARLSTIEGNAKLALGWFGAKGVAEVFPLDKGSTLGLTLLSDDDALGAIRYTNSDRMYALLSWRTEAEKRPAIAAALATKIEAIERMAKPGQMLSSGQVVRSQ